MYLRTSPGAASQFRSMLLWVTSVIVNSPGGGSGTESGQKITQTNKQWESQHHAKHPCLELACSSATYGSPLEQWEESRTFRLSGGRVWWCTLCWGQVSSAGHPWPWLSHASVKVNHINSESSDGYYQAAIGLIQENQDNWCNNMHSWWTITL